jgi:hypothetical protein
MEYSTLIRIFLETYFLFLANPLFWLVVVLVAIQYRRVIHTEMQIFGRAKHPFWEHAVLSALAGLVGGLLASILLVAFGISLLEIGIWYVWPLAVMLLLVNPRYLCFAYAGGLVGAFSAILQIVGRYWPVLLRGPLIGIAAINIPGLLALIGILHLTESFLIAISGHLYASPLLLKTKKGMVGGFSLQKFWPLPLVGLMSDIVPESLADTLYGTQMPEWWPIFAGRATVRAGMALGYILLPVVAGLGYGDLAISTPPRQKSRSSALNLAIYSVILIAVSFLAFRLPGITIAAALFAPLGHEFLIVAGNKKEFSGTPLYAIPPKGVRVLDLFPESPAEAAGLGSGDVVLAVNGLAVYSVRHLIDILQLHSGGNVMLEVERNGEKYELQINNLSGEGDTLGIIPVPDGHVPVFVELKETNFFSSFREKIRSLSKNS